MMHSIVQSSSTAIIASSSSKQRRQHQRRSSLRSTFNCTMMTAERHHHEFKLLFISASKNRASRVQERRRTKNDINKFVVSAKAAKSDSADDVKDKLKDISEKLSEKWADTDEKPAAVALAVFALVGLVALDGVVHNIEGLPLIPDLFELIGIVFSGFFVYQNLLFKPDRQAFKDSVSKTFEDIL